MVGRDSSPAASFRGDADVESLLVMFSRADADVVASRPTASLRDAGSPPPQSGCHILCLHLRPLTWAFLQPQTTQE